MHQRRNNGFSASRRAPFSNAKHELQLRDETVTGALPFLNPTHAVFDHSPPLDQKTDGRSSAQFQWRSRDNRKGRHTLIVDEDDPTPSSTSFTAISKGIGRMLATFPYWDISFWVAFLFTIGCAIFIVNGLFYWLPQVAPNSTFPHEETTGGGVTAFVGATLFQIGAVLVVIEATNENQAGCFGWELERALSEKKSSGYRPKREACTHHHHNRKSFVSNDADDRSTPPNGARRWEWWPTWNELRNHYFHELGFIASFTLFVGATIFYTSAILDLPGVFDHLPQGVLWGVYWLTYLVGGVIFIISAILYLLEVQPNWYTPQPRVIGWHAGVWNLIGAVGWTLSASLGYCSKSWCGYQSDLSLIWASFCYFVGSAILWYEALDKYPVVKKKMKKPGQ